MSSSRSGDTAGVELAAEMDAPCSPAAVFTYIDDLDDYPAWMGLVHRATRLQSDSGELPRWDVELRARIGPFARSKRLVMARTTFDQDRLVVFERRESDGRRHSLWRLTAAVEPRGTGSHLLMQLHYGGSLWTGGVAERVLHDEINRSRDRLLSLTGETTR
jgi:Polyketide cyclase / dehydrase and lipid transport